MVTQTPPWAAQSSVLGFFTMTVFTYCGMNGRYNADLTCLRIISRSMPLFVALEWLHLRGNANLLTRGPLLSHGWGILKGHCAVGFILVLPNHRHLIFCLGFAQTSAKQWLFPWWFQYPIWEWVNLALWATFFQHQLQHPFHHNKTSQIFWDYWAKVGFLQGCPAEVESHVQLQ